MPITFTEDDFTEGPQFSESDFEEPGQFPPPLPLPPSVAPPTASPRQMLDEASRALATPLNTMGRASIGLLDVAGRELAENIYGAEEPRTNVSLPPYLSQRSILGEEPMAAREALGPGSALPKPARFVGRAGQGLIETAPKLAAMEAAGMAGIPPWVSAPAIFGATEEGFDPKAAAIAAALPVAGRFSGALVGRVADVLGVKSPQAINWMMGVAGTAGPAAAMLAEGEREIAKLPKEQQENARLELWESIAGQAALGPMGVKWRKGLDAIHAQSPQILRNVQAQPREGTRQVPAPARGGEAGERGGQGPEVSEAEQKRLLLKSKGEASLQQAQATGNEGLIQIAQDQLTEINQTIARERQQERDEALAALHPYEREELSRQELDTQIAALERDPAVRGGQEYAGRNPDGSPIMVDVPIDQGKVNRLRDLKAQREPEGDYTDAEFDVDVDELKRLGKEFGRDVKVIPGTGELPTGDQPFLSGEYGRPNAQGGLEFLGWYLRGKLARMAPTKRIAFLKSIAAHEAIHSYTTNAEAVQYLRSLSGIERNLNYRIYTGYWNPSELRYAMRGRGRDFSESDLGHEAVRRRLEKLLTGTTTENIDSVLKERVKVATLDILANMVRGTREAIVRGEGTKTQAGLKILDDVLDRIQKVKVAVLQQPDERRAAAFEKPGTLSEPVKDFIGQMDKGKTSGGNKLSSAAGMQARGIRDLEALADLRRRYEAKQDELYAKAKETKDREKQLNFIVEANTLNPRVQLAREAIEVATKVGSWTTDMNDPQLVGKDRPLDWRNNPEIADWLKKNGAKLGISLPPELKAETPAAFDKAQHQRNLDQQEFDLLYNAWFTKLRPWQQDTIRKYAAAVTTGEGIDTALSNLTVGLGKGRDLERAKRAIQLANKLHLPPEHPANQRGPAAFEKQRENEERKLRLTKAGTAADEQMLKHLRTLPATQLEQMLQQREKYLESRFRLGAGRLNPGADIRNRKAFENQIRVIRQEIERRGEQAGPAAFEKISDEDLWSKATGRIGIRAPQLNLRQLETIKQNSGIQHAFVDDDGALVKMHIKGNGVRIMVFPQGWNFGDPFGVAETVHDVGPKMGQFNPEMHRNVGQGTLRIPPNKHLDKELSLRAARELIWHYTREGGVPEWTGRIPPIDETSFPAVFGKPGDLPEQQKPKEGPLVPPKPPSNQPELPKGPEAQPFELPNARFIEDTATKYLDQAIATGKPPDYDAYLGELQGKYGGMMTKEKAFYPWMDSVTKHLLSAKGDEIRKMLGRMGLVPDVAEALKPNEEHPLLGAIPDAAPVEAMEQTLKQTGLWPQQERLTTGPRRRIPQRERDAQNRRMAAIGAILDKMAAEAGGRPRRETLVKEVGPEDILTKFVVLQPGEEVMTKEGEPTGEFTQPMVDTQRVFHRFTPEEAGNAVTVGKIATSELARPSNQAKRSLTRSVIALRDKINDRIQLVGAYKHQRKGPVVVNPSGAGPDIRIDDQLLSRYEPVSTMILRDPVESFRQTFQSLDEFARWFGAEGIEGTPGVATSSLTGPLAGVAREQAGITRPGRKPTPIEDITGTLGEQPSPTARELTVPRFARKTVPREPLQLPETSEQLQPPKPSGPQMLSPEDQAKLTARVQEESQYTPTEIKTSRELEKRNIFITPGARGERVPGEQIGFQRFRKPVKKGPPAAFDKYQDFADAYFEEMQKVYNLLNQLPDQRKATQLFDFFTDAYEKTKGDVATDKLPEPYRTVFNQIKDAWDNIHKYGEENPQWTKLYTAKPDLMEGRPRVGPGLGPAALEKPGEEFNPARDRTRETLFKVLENSDDFKRTLATFRTVPSSILESWLKQPEPQPNEMSEAGIALWKKSQQAIRDELDRRGEDSFPAARDKWTPQDEYDYYAKRLRNPELLDHSIWFKFRDGILLAVPVGGSRKSGSLGIIELMSRDEANDLADQLRDQPGFPDVRVVKGPRMYQEQPQEHYMVEWGKPIDWSTGMKPEPPAHRELAELSRQLGNQPTGMIGEATQEFHDRLGQQFGYEQGYGVDYPTDTAPWPMPGEPYPQQGLFGQTYPQAFDKTLAMMKEGVERVRDTALDMWRTGALEDRMAQGLDQIGNRKNNEAHQAELPIRMASMRKPTTMESLKFWKQHWTQGNREVLHAANAVVESEFNQSKLQDFRDQLDVAEQNARLMLQSTSWRTRQTAKAYLRDIAASRAEVEYADAHWNDPALKLTANRVKRTLDRQVRLEQAMGIDVRRQAGYVPHRLVDVWGEDTLFSLPGVLGTKFQAPRSFKTHYDALAAGPYMRITHDIASLVHHRVRQGLGKIYRDQWKAGLLDIDMPDGLKLAMQPVQLANGNIRAPNNNYKLVPTENFGYLAIHKDAADMMKNLLSPSWVESSPKVRALLHWEQKLKHSLLIGDFFHFARMVYYGTSVLGRQALRMPGNIGKYGWSALDIAPGDVQEAVRKGVITQREADWANQQVPHTGMTRRELIERAYREHGANLGRITDALYKDLLTDLTPTAGKLRRGFVRVIDPTVGRYNRFLFDKMTRGLMSESIVREFERQFKPGMNPDAVLRDISRDINERFGNIGRQGVFKSKTAQDLARIFFLAPQWVEGMARTELRATGRLTGAAKLAGRREGLSMLGTTGHSMGKAMVFMFGLTQAINLLTRGKPTWKNDEEGHKMDAWIPSVGGGDGFWFNPLSLFMELSHDLYRLGETRFQRGQELGGTLTQILSNKLSPVSRALLVMGSGSTPTGQRITSASRRMLTEPAKAMAPVPITFSKYVRYGGHAVAPHLVEAVPKGQMQRQAVGTVGIKIEPAISRPAIIGRLADKFMRREGLKKDSGWEQVQTDEASYTKLRAAIRDHDNSRAKDVYEDLLKGRTEEDINNSMKLSYQRPFTGSQAAENLFIESLSEPELEMYQQARERQMDDYEAFVSWLARQP